MSGSERKNPFHFRAFFLCILLCLLPLSTWAESSTIQFIKGDEKRPTLGAPGQLEVHFINVASADCILLRMDGYTMLVDSGLYGNYERVTQYLKALGVDRLDYAFGSHPHDDHIGGFFGILQEVPVGLYLQPGLYEDFTSKESDQLKTLLEEKSIPVETVANESEMSLGGAKLTFYQWQNPEATENNRSMILKVTVGQRSVLLAADISTFAQRALAEQYGSSLRADILKMPHHGLTKYQITLHEAVLPELLTISNIKAKVEEVWQTAERRGVQPILTTKGTIVAVTDGGAVWKVWQIPREQ